MEEDDNFKETRLNYEIYKKHLPDDFTSFFEKYLEFRDFHLGVSEALEDACLPQLEKLCRQHYPPLDGDLHPLLAEWVTTTHTATCFGIAYQMKGLVNRMNEGMDVAATYPKLEEWREFYLHPKPNTLEDSERSLFRFPDDDEWEKEKERENREMLRFHLWEEQRKKEFYDIIQPPLWKLYPVLETLEGDFWVLYAVEMRDAYEEWLSMMEHIEGIIEYEMPPESINWENKKFREEHYARYQLNPKRESKRLEMIDAFKLPDE